jgi:hypothetical protein
MNSKQGDAGAPCRAGWSRRNFVGSIALLALATGVPAAALDLAKLDDVEPPNPARLALLREVGELVLPRGATPGAGTDDVAGFVLLALAHGLEGSRQPLPPLAAERYRAFVRADLALDHCGYLRAELDSRAGGDFLAASPTQRAAIVAALDSAAFADPQPVHPWRTLKALILTGYYTSEVGAAQELQYELVPGRYDADLALAPGDRAWSSDWTAVDFG